jgi:hypothetical protein
MSLQSLNSQVPLPTLLTEYVQQTRHEARRRQGLQRLGVFLLVGILGALSLIAPDFFPLFLLGGICLVAMRLESYIAPAWVRQGTLVLEALTEAPKETLPELFALGEALENLPKLRKRTSRRDPNAQRSNRLVFEIQEALFVTLTRLLAYRSSEELEALSSPQRAFLRRAIFRTADANFITCALLVLATLQDTELWAQAEEFSACHPSERIREAASEYLHTLTAS